MTAEPRDIETGIEGVDVSADAGERPARIERIGVVGVGVMGSGIAEVCAAADLDVRVAVTSGESAARGLARIERSLGRAVDRDTLSGADRDKILERIAFTTDLADLADRQLVIEAVREDERTKLEVIAALDAVVADPDAILASNTSSIPLTRLACATTRPGRVLGVHFFNPVPAMQLVEVVGSLLTDAATLDRAEGFVAEALGKQPIRVADRAGFIVNALLIPYLLAAIRMVESGHSDAESVDRAMVLGCAHPLGPLKLADLIGLDVVASIADALHEEFKEPQHVRPPLLSRMVECGRLGRKSGSGFFSYPR
jgi:3-hydroxybutyryl-CoA dehydrogenase